MTSCEGLIGAETAGMFLFAKLVTSNLTQSIDKEEFLEEIDGFPEELHQASVKHPPSSTCDWGTLAKIEQIRKNHQTNRYPNQIPTPTLENSKAATGLDVLCATAAKMERDSSCYFHGHSGTGV
jgi:hypothetical protein